MKRRRFISQSLLGTGALTLGAGFLANCTGNTARQITILHTNDVHSQIDPYDASHPEFPNMGGAAKRATLVQQIRAENPNTLLLDAGDIFQGTPYFNFYGGEVEYKVMSLLKYDAATLGNHDFDNGLNGLLAQVPHKKFEWLSANYDFSQTDLVGYVKPYTVIEKAGIRIGVFGLGIELNGLVDPRLYGKTRYTDPIDAAQKTTRLLRDELGCHLVICLSHLGYRFEGEKVSDRVLAEQTNGIDLIIGGHTHTLMHQPEVLKNKNGEDVMINQVGYKGTHLGRVDFFFGEKSVDAKGQSMAVV